MVAPSGSNCAGRTSELPCVKPPVGLSERSCEAVKGQRPAHAGGNHRNGTSAKTVLTEVGPIPLEVPAIAEGEFQPQIIPKHARRVEGFSEAVVLLYAKGS
jgi:transposase-like protein